MNQKSGGFSLKLPKTVIPAYAGMTKFVTLAHLPHTKVSYLSKVIASQNKDTIRLYQLRWIHGQTSP